MRFCVPCDGTGVCVCGRRKYACNVCVPSLAQTHAARIAAAQQIERAGGTDFGDCGFFPSLSSLAAWFDIDVHAIGPSLCPFFTLLPASSPNDAAPRPGCLKALVICPIMLILTGCDDLLAAINSVRVVAAHVSKRPQLDCLV